VNWMMTQPLNYCTQAAENMRIINEDLFKREADQRTNLAIATSAREAIILMHLAEKFILPEWGKIFEKHEIDLISDVQIPTRLPYPIVALEYHCDYRDPRCEPMMPQELESSKRIALCVETEALHEHTTLFAHVHDNHIGSTPGYYVFPVCYSDGMKCWTPPPATMFFPRGGNEQMQAMKDLGLCAVLPLGYVCYKHYPESERSTRAARDVADEVFAMIHLLTALAIDKGKHTLLPAPVKLNKKRAKKGRIPMYEYKILDIVADVLQAPQSASKPHQGGTHASPRMHKRRGHVRRLRSGRTTWVRNAIIGKPGHGSVEKEYSVHE